MKLYAGLGAALVAVVLAIVLFSGGDQSYRVRLVLNNAHGLREGSSVRIGDVDVGKVAKVDLASGDRVVVEAEVDKAHAPVGRDATVSIGALNLLGQKFLEIDKGDVSTPAPSGMTIDPSRVTVSTDLAQVLDVLDATTQARLEVLFNEAGLAVTGRKQDIRTLLAAFPHTLQELNRLTDAVASDNHTLGDLIDHSGRFIAQMNAERGPLVDTVRNVGASAKVFADDRADLAATLHQAPATLRSAQTFLAKLQATTVPLGPAARDLTATAAPLSTTLARLPAFEQSAKPALAGAKSAAPQLSKLGTQASPVVRRGVKTMTALSNYATAAAPAMKTLDGSADNIFSILDNWTRAIQYRDNLSHYFRGEATVTSNSMTSMIDRLTATQSKGKRPTSAKQTRTPASQPAQAAQPAATAVPKDPVKSVTDTVNGLTNQVTGVVDNVVGGLLKPPLKTEPKTDPSNLLDFLLVP